MLSSLGFPLTYSGRRNTATKSIFLFFPFLLTDNIAFLSLKVSLMHFDAIWLCFYSSLWFLHFLTTFFRPCQKIYSQSTCLNRHGLCYASFLFIEFGPRPGDISESCAALPFLSISAITHSRTITSTSTCAVERSVFIVTYLTYRDAYFKCCFITMIFLIIYLNQSNVTHLSTSRCQTVGMPGQ